MSEVSAGKVVVPPCPSCRMFVNADRDRLGARCPHCRQPLYERPFDPHLASPGTNDGGRCTVHASNPALGTCRRCGNFLCAVCRSAWRDQVLCVACVERALMASEATPEAERGHRRQAIAAVLLGLCAWLMAAGAMAMIVAGVAQGLNQALVGLGALLFMASPLPSVAGVGQGAAAVRARGDSLILATIGLILSGLHTGVFVGFLTFAVLQNQ